MKNTFGNRLKTLRETFNITQKELATMLNVSQQHVSSWENNKLKPDTNTVIKIAITLNVTTDYLLGLSNLYT